ncbi:MAG: LemA family protein [Bacteroidia bacterium]|nr:LemA family protein [Bacteroidia bacterium]
MQRILLILGILVLFLGGCGYFAGKNNYNRMVELQENVDAQWGQVQNVYQRRADLIPNIMETAKGYANFEQETLSGVAEARAKVGQITVTKEVLEDPQLMARFSEAQNQLGQTLSRLLSVSENYPDLKANENFQALIVELEGSENRISVERKKFNDVARDYNTYIKKFPSNIFANFFGFDDVAYFEAQAGTENAPKVSFE